MASSSDIRAGRAFVELYLNKSLLSKGLKAVGSEIQAAGDRIKAVGKALAATAGLVTAPILAAAKTWSAAGSDMYRASQRTGMGVEFLSGLKFAANQTGSSFEAMEVSIKKSQKFLGQLAEGSQGAQQTLHRLGLTTADLAGLSPEQKYAKLAKAVGAVRDPASRTTLAMAVFGRSGTQLLPMLAQYDALMEKAARNRRIMSPEDAKSAEKLEIAFTDLLDVGKGFTSAIGSAVAPMLSNLADRLSDSARAAVDWVKAHRQGVVQALQFAGAALGVGAAVMGVGYAISFVGGAILKLRQGLMAAGHVLGLLSTGFGILPIVASAGAAIVGTVWSVAAGIVGIAWAGVTAIPAMLSTAWGAAASFVALAWSSPTAIATAAWTAFAAISSAVSAAWSAAGTIAGAAWSAAGALAHAAWLWPFALAAAGVAVQAAAAAVVITKYFSPVKAAVKDIAGGLGEAIGGVTSIAQSGGHMVATGFRGAASAARVAFSEAAGYVKTDFAVIWADAKAGFASVTADGKAAFGAISDAIQVGDIQGAISVAVAFGKLEWTKLVNWLDTTWINVKSQFLTVMSDVQAVLTSTFLELKAQFAQFKLKIDVAAAAVEAFCNSIANNPIIMGISGENPFKGATPPAAATPPGAKVAAGRRAATPEEQERSRNAGIESEEEKARAARNKKIEEERAAAAQAAQDKAAADNKKAQGDFNAILEAQRKKNEERKAKAAGEAPGANQGGTAGSDFAMNQKYKASVLSGAAAAMMYGGAGGAAAKPIDQAKEQRKAMIQLARETHTSLKKIEACVAVWGLR